MTEIEKMFENAEVEKVLYCCDYTCGEPTRGCKDCPDIREIYPPFTAEKQIELIKWLLKNFDIDFSRLGQIIDTSLDGINCIGGIGSANTFEDSLCMAVNDLWQDLTEEERAQIRGILE